ncbi:MAG: TAXI family TRAP transporter solute-binding subunit [Alphaproteobacteria bacterium]|nr:TAXI family TRAP transporter solute-binding subunit [Alphaproteobacteria bacterium]
MRVTLPRISRRLAITAVVAGLAFSPGVGAAQSLEWSAGSVGGSWFTIVTGLANLVMEKNPDIRLRITPGGGRDNPTKVQGGVSQIGMGIDFLAAAAMKGEDPYNQRHDKLRSIGGGWSPAPFHVVRAATAPADLREAMTRPNLRIGTTPRATSEELTLRRTLEFYGSSYERVRQQGGSAISVSYSDLTAAFIDGRIDYFWGAAGLPSGAVAEIAEGRRAAVLMPMPRDLMEHLQKTFGYGIGEIPAGTYPRLQSGAVPVTSLEAIIMVSADVPADFVYRFTRTLLENRGRFTQIHASMKDFNPGTAWRNQPVPLHPGAERAYRELGFMR